VWTQRVPVQPPVTVGNIVASHSLERLTGMGFNPKDAIDSARDIATYTIEMSADIVDNAVEILKGNIAEGVGNIVQDSLDIAGHAVKKTLEIFTGRGED
jgi:hypothetical protein